MEGAKDFSCSGRCLRDSVILGRGECVWVGRRNGVLLMWMAVGKCVSTWGIVRIPTGLWRPSCARVLELVGTLDDARALVGGGGGQILRKGEGRVGKEQGSGDTLGP